MYRNKSSFRRLLVICLTSLPLCLLFLGLSFGNSNKTQETYKNLEVFANVLNEIQKNYVEEVDPKLLLEGAIKGMLAALDPHSSYMTPDDFKEMQVETKGSFNGIGIEITLKEGVLTVVSPIEGTPAFKAGIKAGDMIVKIAGESTKDMSLMEAIKKLRGPKGSEVTISIFRQGWTESKEITITRDVIPLYSVRSKSLEPGYVYVRITNFQANTGKDLKKALKDLSQDKELAGLILDLRNNPGGLLDQSVKVADFFLTEGDIVSTRGRLTDQDMEYKAHTSSDDYSFPMVVLVNGGSASASEIVAGALQDHKRALILGTQTFGKGSVQTIIPMSDGAGLRLTTARYYTPNGTSIQAKGITPDALVPERSPYAEQPDTNGKPKKTLRESDLRHHLKNGNEPVKNGNEPAEEKQDTPPAQDDKKIEDQEKAAPPDDAESDQKLEDVEKDYQLNTALTVLKSLKVFSGQRQN